MSKPFAVFDIDGTVIRWQLYHAIVDELGHQQIISAADYQSLKAARMVWKRRTSETSFKEYEQEVIRVHDKAITSLTEQAFIALATKVFNEYKEQTYTYTRDLIRELKSKGYLLFAISASQTQIVKLLADYYGFDDYGGSVYEVSRGQFTGEKEVLKRERKPIYLKELVAKYKATFEGSFGVGDSESDIPMLETVENPIAFNPDQGLFKLAKQREWPLVVERKNVVYKFAKEHGRYLLA